MCVHHGSIWRFPITVHLALPTAASIPTCITQAPWACPGTTDCFRQSSQQLHSKPCEQN